MISKISIENIASYKAMTTLETDKKVNVVYGLNGSGKSTLSNFLYQLDTPEYQDCSVEMSKGTSLYVYNQKFIEENFYEADNLKGIFSLSKENKNIENDIASTQEQLKTQLLEEEKEQDFTNAERKSIVTKRLKACGITWEIKQEFTGGDRILEGFLDGLKGNKETLYAYLSNLSKPDLKPDKDMAQLKADVEALRGDTAQTYSLLNLLGFDEHEIESDPIFEQVIVGNTNSSVSALMTL
jgi:chromosome segregation ATPase